MSDKHKRSGSKLGWKKLPIANTYPCNYGRYQCQNPKCHHIQLTVKAEICQRCGKSTTKELIG